VVCLLIVVVSLAFLMLQAIHAGFALLSKHCIDFYLSFYTIMKHADVILFCVILLFLLHLVDTSVVRCHIEQLAADAECCQ